jgi:hypothetical protein
MFGLEVVLGVGSHAAAQEASPRVSARVPRVLFGARALDVVCDDLVTRADSCHGCRRQHAGDCGQNEYSHQGEAVLL